MPATTNEQLHRELGHLTSQVEEMRNDIAEDGKSREALRTEVRELMSKQDTRIVQVEEYMKSQQGFINALKWVGGAIMTVVGVVIGWMQIKHGG